MGGLTAQEEAAAGVMAFPVWLGVGMLTYEYGPAWLFELYLAVSILVPIILLFHPAFGEDI